jgi:hypothetical protein
MTATIAEQVSNLAKTMAAQPSKQVLAAFIRELAHLARQEAPERLISVGATLDDAHTLNLAAELAGTGIAVNVFQPGSADTALHRPPNKCSSARALAGNSRTRHADHAVALRSVPNRPPGRESHPSVDNA